MAPPNTCAEISRNFYIAIMHFYHGQGQLYKTTPSMVSKYRLIGNQYLFLKKFSANYELHTKYSSCVQIPDNFCTGVTIPYLSSARLRKSSRGSSFLPSMNISLVTTLSTASGRAGPRLPPFYLSLKPLLRVLMRRSRQRER